MTTCPKGKPGHPGASLQMNTNGLTAGSQQWVNKHPKFVSLGLNTYFHCFFF